MKFRIREVQEIMLDTADVEHLTSNLTSNPDADDVAEFIDEEGLEAVIDLLGPERLQLRRSLDVDPLTDAVFDPTTSPGMTDLMVDPETLDDYSIEILDQAFEPGTYGGWTVQFKVPGAPRLSYQKQDPILEAFIPLERAPDNAPKLTSGGGSSLARSSNEHAAVENAMFNPTAAGQALRGFTGAAVVESAPVVYGNAPVALPSDEVVAAACSKSLRAHLAAVEAEKARLAVTEGGESIVGKRLKVKG